jgi:hypothetical protein
MHWCVPPRAGAPGIRLPTTGVPIRHIDPAHCVIGADVRRLLHVFSSHELFDWISTFASTFASTFTRSWNTKLMQSRYKVAQKFKPSWYRFYHLCINFARELAYISYVATLYKLCSNFWTKMYTKLIYRVNIKSILFAPTLYESWYKDDTELSSKTNLIQLRLERTWCQLCVNIISTLHAISFKVHTNLIQRWYKVETELVRIFSTSVSTL